MRLGAQFSLAMLAVFLAGGAVAYVAVTRAVRQNARAEVLEKAGLMMGSSLAMRKYTTEQIRPLLAGDASETFHPQTVPAYAATEMFNSLREADRSVSYKEATLNPSNLRDKATDWEADVVEHFRNNPTAKEHVGERSGATGPTLFIARPIRVEDADCLTCHGNPADVPKAVAIQYGRTNGTGWKLGEVVGAQIASVPTSVADERADRVLRYVLGSLLGVLAAVLLATNLLLSRMVVAPLSRIAAHADAVSMGATSPTEIDERGAREVSTLAAAFNRMSRSLKKALDLLEK